MRAGINTPIPVPLPMFAWSGNKGSVLGSHSLYGKACVRSLCGPGHSVDSRGLTAVSTFGLNCGCALQSSLSSFASR
jgi:hypothetical protein